MKRFEELSYEEKTTVSKWFGCWLHRYTYEAIKRVMERRDEILANEFAMNLLKELYERETKERADFANSMRLMLDDYELFGKYDPHNHPIEHSDSYRDILYDMFIAERKESEEC